MKLLTERYSRQNVENIWNLLRVKNIKGKYDIELGKNFGVYKTVWTDSKYDAGVHGTKLLKSVIPDSKFSYPKSIYNVIDCISSVVNDDKNAIILDFFGGSGTTGHAVMEINKDGGNRHFILVEQMDYIQTDTLPRNVEILKSINDNTTIVYCELAKFNQEWIEKIKNASTNAELNDIYKKIQSIKGINAYLDPSVLNEETGEFEKLAIDDKKKILISVIDKNTLYYNFSEIDDDNTNISSSDKEFTKSFYGD